MREFTKAMFSFSWAMSLFSVQQLSNLLARPDPGRPKPRTAEAFDNVTCATEEQLGGFLRDTFKTGDKLQRGMVDMLFGAFMMRGQGAEAPRRAGADGTACCGQASQEGGANEARGWGPMPGQDGPAGGEAR
jgi:hypothetical protein